MTQSKTVRVGILGGGISGLSLAYYLLKLARPGSIQVHLFEASSQLGGCSRREHPEAPPNSTPYVFGAKTFRLGTSKAKPLLYMLDDLDMRDRLRFSASSGSRPFKRYIYEKDRIQEITASNLFNPESRVKALFRLGMVFGSDLIFKKNISPAADISVHDLAAKVVSEEFAERVVDTFMLGIYGTTGHNLSLEFCFNNLYKAINGRASLVRYLFAPDEPLNLGNSALEEELNRSSLVSEISRDKPLFMNAAAGLGEIVERVWQKLETQHDDVFTGLMDTAVTSISLPANSDNPVTLYAGSDQRFEFDHLFSTLPANILCDLLEPGEVRNSLSGLHYSTVAQVILQYAPDILPNINNTDFGILIAQSAKSVAPALGIMFDSNLFSSTREPRKSIMFTVFLGGQHFKEFLGDFDTVTNESILKRTKEIMKIVLNISATPIDHRIRITTKCILQPQLGHKKIVDACSLSCASRRLYLCGTMVSGLAVPHCVYNSLLAANKLISSLSIGRFPDDSLNT